MKQKYRLFRRASGIYFVEDKATGKQESLRTRDKAEAHRLVHAQNEAHQQPLLNLQIARAYLAAGDPEIAKRTWHHVMNIIIETKTGSTKNRWIRAAQDAAFDSVRHEVVLGTSAEQLLRVLHEGTVSTNVYLRRLHNFAIDMNWLPTPIIPRRQWPQVKFKEKRAITLAEHQMILGREGNPELKSFYQLCWHLGGSQSDIAQLHAEDVDWNEHTISYRRKKSGTPIVIHIGPELEKLLKTLPPTGAFFPKLEHMHEKHRASFFKRRCMALAISGISLHSYRYAWAERAKMCGYPERWAQQALGHNSKAVHRAYAKKAQVKLPNLEEYEQKVIAAEFGKKKTGS